MIIFFVTGTINYFFFQIGSCYLVSITSLCVYELTDLLKLINFCNRQGEKLVKFNAMHNGVNMMRNTQARKRTNT
jgi:hypothetical protein